METTESTFQACEITAQEKNKKKRFRKTVLGKYLGRELFNKRDALQLVWVFLSLSPGKPGTLMLTFSQGKDEID